MRDSDGVLTMLIDLVRRLVTESEGLLDLQDQAQLWYNRGYAEGILAAIRELGHAAALPSDLTGEPDPVLAEAIRAQSMMPWGRAHAHGVEMGRNETFEVLGRAES